MLALGMVLNACGNRQTQKMVIQTSVRIDQSTSSAREPSPTETLPTVPPEAGLTTPTPAVDQTPAPGGLIYHQPPVRIYNGQRPYQFGLLAADQGPFFASLARGGQQAAANLGVELFAQFPQNGEAVEQTQMLDALLARGDLDALIVSSVDPQALLPALQKAAAAGILLITIQTNLAIDPSVVPLAAIITDDHLGGFTACQALANGLIPSEPPAGKTPLPPKKVYIQKGRSGLFDPEAQVQGCKDALSQFTDIELVGEDSNDGDSPQASQQVSTILAQSPDLSAIFCTDSLCAQAASQVLDGQGLRGKVKIAALEATPAAVDLLRQGAIDMLVTPKPADMGYLAVILTTAVLDGVTSLPSSFTTGWQTLTPQSLTDPVAARWLYASQTGSAQPAEPRRTTAGLKVAFLPGIEDPFYYTMQRGAQLAATSLGATLLSQFPTDWNATEQAQILSQMYASGPFNALLLVPTDPLAVLPALQLIVDAGVPIVTLDTPLDPSFSPLVSLRSDDQAGGEFACRSLAQAIGGSGKLYIQNVTPGIPTTDAREHGCQMALSKFSDITLVAVNYNEDDPAKAQAQLGTILQNFPDLSAVFSTNVLGAQAVGQYLADQGLSGKVKVAAFDATATAIDLLRSGLIDMVVAQKPADMGYLGLLFAAAWLDGVRDLPAHLSTGYVLLTRDNMDDPEYSRYFYTK